MNTTWIIVLAVLGLVASAGSAIAWIRGRAPRQAVDPQRLALLRDSAADRELRTRALQLQTRRAEQRRSRTRTPRPVPQHDSERLWAGGI